MSATHDTVEDFYDAVHTDILVVRAGGEFWQAWETEDGDWYAARPRHEDDPEGPDGDRWRPIGPELIERLQFPIEAHDDLGGEES